MDEDCVAFAAMTISAWSLPRAISQLPVTPVGTVRARRSLLGRRLPMAQLPRDGDVRPTEDDIQRAKLGPRGVPGEPDPAKMTPQRAKKTPPVKDPGQTA